jgi:hypothetical protein
MEYNEILIPGCGCEGEFSAFFTFDQSRENLNDPNIWSFIRFCEGGENRFRRMRIQFNAGLAAS